jgi:hypothetical protein
MLRASIFVIPLLFSAVSIIGAQPAPVQQAKPRATADTVRVEREASGDVNARRAAVTKDRPVGSRWACRATPSELRAQAARTYARLLPDTGEAYREFAAELGIPVSRDAFMQDFRVVTEAADCRRVGASLEREGYPINDGVRAFRVGRVFFVPAVEGGVILRLDGGVIGGFRAPR